MPGSMSLYYNYTITTLVRGVRYKASCKRLASWDLNSSRGQLFPNPHSIFPSAIIIDRISQFVPAHNKTATVYLVPFYIKVVYNGC